MKRLFLLLSLIAGAALHSAETSIALAPAGSPLAVVAETVELTVGKEMSMVSGRYMYQYVEKDDFDHQARLVIQYPLYIEKGLKSREDMISASSVRLQIGEETFYPVSAEYIPAEELSEYPVPEDAGVAMMTFDIPRSSARLRFEVIVTHLAPNFRYQGKLLAAFTPWLPKYHQFKNAYGLQDHDFEVTLRAIGGFALKPFPTKTKVLRSTATDLLVTPEHGRTIAAEVVDAETSAGK